MSSNKGVIDSKPSNLDAIDPLSNNKASVDTKPNNQISTFGLESEQLFTVVIPRGQSMGLLLALTYPVAGTVQSPITN